MGQAVFPFPGGKSRIASWILEHLPEHDCYVEVFGGAAGVLVNKEPSDVEIYNDADGDLVHFFGVLRDRPDELADWLESVPYARELYDIWADRYYHGYRPTDSIERAGQFFYLRYAQWGGKYADPAGFGTSKIRNQASPFANKIEKLEAFAERFDDVVIENLDWEEVLNKYDGPDTAFYADPPYIDKESYYRVGAINHEAFVAALDDLDGEWVVSYSELPDAIGGYEIIGKDEKRYINNGKTGSTNEAREHLILSSGA